MTFYIISLILVLLHFLTLNFIEVRDGVFLILACIPLIPAIIVQGVYYFSQAEDIEKITEQEEKKIIETKESEIILEELKTHLTEKYPNFERDIFDKIKPQNVSIHIAKYPELRSSETVLEYIKNITRFQKRIFDCDREIATLKRQIRTRIRTCKLFCFPILPKP